MKKLAMSFVLLASGASGQALLPGNALYDPCVTNKGDVTGDFSCLSYIIGIVEGATIAQLQGLAITGALPETTDETNKMISFLNGYCIPSDVRFQDLTNAVVDYIGIRPWLLNEAARTVVHNAYIETFPCE